MPARTGIFYQKKIRSAVGIIAQVFEIVAQLAIAANRGAFQYRALRVQQLGQDVFDDMFAKMLGGIAGQLIRQVVHGHHIDGGLGLLEGRCLLQAYLFQYHIPGRRWWRRPY